MPEVISLQWPCQVDWKSVSEDAFFADKSRGIFVVTDGVTRRGFTGAYPDPSPARQAADAVVETIGKTLTAPLTDIKMMEAFAQANQSVRAVNQSLGLWGSHDWWGRDLAGTVAACLAVQDSAFLYGFITDCGVAQVSAAGDLIWHTPNTQEAAKKHFPLVEEVGERERFVRVRRDFRNRPEAKHPTFGVLTGEEAALSYVEVGTRT